MRLMILLAVCCLTANIGLSGCQPDSETIIKLDTIFINQTDTLIVNQLDTVELTEYIADSATTWILLRHAETTGAGSNPVLSAAGEERAEVLRQMFNKVPLDAAFASQYIRTKNTVQPTAIDHSLNLQEYSASAYAGLITTIEQQYEGGTVLVAGHSNTVPSILNILTKSNQFTDLSETQYDNLYIVSVYKSGKNKILQLKYGKPTP
ncbi:MAG: phosphoglycerate mutase family protein [Saprospiraceae bacterium]